MLDNIKIEPLNPSNSHIVHKMTYNAITMYVHLSGKVDTHLQSSIYNYCHIPYCPKNENTFIVPRHTIVGQRRFFSKIWLIDASLSMKG